MNSVNTSCSKELAEKVQRLEKINQKLTALHWIFAQITSEQDINTMYNLIINGFSEIISIEKCIFCSIDDTGEFTQITSCNITDHDSFELCSGILNVLKQALSERVAMISLNHHYCGECNKELCSNMRLQVCVLYNRNDNPTGVLVGYDFNNGEISEQWAKILELYALQISLVMENATLNARLRNIAITDGLTGLYNHRYFMECLIKQVGRSKNASTSFCLIFLDVDDFKHYNDNFGHPASDKVLQTVAFIIEKVIQKPDMVFRYGGEEFAVILTDCTIKSSYDTIEKVRINIAKHNFEHRRITMSIGVAEFPEHTTEAKHLLMLADKMLYLAKSRGKNIVCYPE